MNNYILKSQYYCEDLTPEAQVEDWVEILQSWGIFTQAISWIFSHSRGVFQPATGARGASSIYSKKAFSLTYSCVLKLKLKQGTVLEDREKK
jgi:hypothetical protein